MTDRPIEQQRAANEYASKLKTGDDRMLLAEAFLAGIDWHHTHIDNQLRYIIEEMDKLIVRLNQSSLNSK